MKIYIKPSVEKELRKIPKAEFRKIAKKLRILPQDPYAGKPLKGKYRNKYSIRAWPYRIVYEVRSDRIIVYSVAHRQGVYK